MLDEYDDIEIVGEAADGEQAVTLAKSLHPDIVIMDVNMPGLDGIEATRQLKRERPDILVIGLSVDSSKQVEDVMRGAGAGSIFDERRRHRATSRNHSAGVASPCVASRSSRSGPSRHREVISPFEQGPVPPDDRTQSDQIRHPVRFHTSTLCWWARVDCWIY